MPNPVMEEARRCLAVYAASQDLKVDVDPDAEGYAFPLALNRPDGSVVHLDIDAYSNSEDNATSHRQLLTHDTMLTAAGFSVLRVPAWRCLDEPHTVLKEALQIPAHPLTATKSPGNTA